MVKNSRSEKKSSGISSKGFYIGVQVWLLFIIGFILLKYGISLSIGLGALGGLAAGLVSAWWRTDEPAQPIIEPTDNNISNLSKARSKSFAKQQQRYTAAKQQRWSRGVGAMGRLFTKNRNTSNQSKQSNNETNEVEESDS